MQSHVSSQPTANQPACIDGTNNRIRQRRKRSNETLRRRFHNKTHTTRKNSLELREKTHRACSHTVSQLHNHKSTPLHHTPRISGPLHPPRLGPRCPPALVAAAAPGSAVGYPPGYCYCWPPCGWPRQTRGSRVPRGTGPPLPLPLRAAQVSVAGGSSPSPAPAAKQT